MVDLRGTEFDIQFQDMVIGLQVEEIQYPWVPQ